MTSSHKENLSSDATVDARSGSRGSSGGSPNGMEDAGSSVRPVLDDELIGTTVGEKYRVERVIGTGGVGVVYQAAHVELGHTVALKVLRSDFENSLGRRFGREAKVLSQLAHPNIVGLTDFGFHEEAPYLVMELLEGRTLRNLLTVQPPSIDAAKSIFRGILRALAFAHAQGVMHRDLKPDNVYLQSLPDDPFHPKLLDFGLAKILSTPDGPDGEPTLTRQGAIIGTPAYMAPEQASGGVVDGTADQYAAGILLFELLTGRVPFDQIRRTELLRAHMVAPVPDPSSIRTGLSMSVPARDILLRLLAKEPEDRFESVEKALEAWDALEEDDISFIEPDDSDATRPQNIPSLEEVREEMDSLAPPATASTKRGNPLLLLAVLGALAFGAAFFFRSQQTPPSQPSSESSELPPELLAIEERMASATEVDREAHREARTYQRQHPEDHRPSLMIAHDLARFGSWPQAVERYRIALAKSSAALDDERMLENLVTCSGGRRNQNLCGDFLLEAYAERARPALEGALNETEQRAVRQRIEALLERMNTPE